MFISKVEYDALVLKAQGGENNPEIKVLKGQVETLEKQTRTAEEDKVREIVNLKQDFALDLARKGTEVETKIFEATKDLTKKFAEAEMKANNATQKAEILETAFKNLGFDVKDMKSILNKLVDGIVSKNTIQLVK